MLYFFEVLFWHLKLERFKIFALCVYIERNDKRVNDIIIALNNLIEQPPKIRKIGFNTSN